jgi:hypothetical protein
MVALIGVALFVSATQFISATQFVSATHLLDSALLLDPARLLHAPLIKTSRFRRITAEWFHTRGCGRATVANVFHTRPGLLGRGLLRLPLIFPLAHPLGANRRRASIMLAEHSCVSRHAGLRRKRRAGLGAVRACLVRVRRVRRLMLRIC